MKNKMKSRYAIMSKNVLLVILGLLFITLMFGCKPPGQTYPENKIGEAYKFNGNKITLLGVRVVDSITIDKEVFYPNKDNFYVIATVEYQFKQPRLLDFNLVYLYNYYLVLKPGTTEKYESIKYIYVDGSMTTLLNDFDCFTQLIKNQTITLVFESEPSIRDMRFFQLGEKYVYFLDQYDYGNQLN